MSGASPAGTGIVYQRCMRCAARWYFPRIICPACGCGRVESRVATGNGTLVAVTVVHRAPSVELEALAPYAIGLVQLEEGFIVMARCDVDVAPEIAGRCKIAEFADALVPWFKPLSVRQGAAPSPAT